MRNGLLSLLVFLLLSVSARAGAPSLEQRFLDAVQAAKITGTNSSLFVLDLSTDRAVVSVSARRPMIPASNMKLVTTAAALGTLGADFNFQTRLRLIDPNPDAAVVLVQGDGDPAFGDTKILQTHNLDFDKVVAHWTAALKSAGIRRVAQLVMDDRVFDRQLIHPAWPAHQLGHWYCAPVSGLMVNDNCLDIWASPTSPGRAPAVTLVPAAPFVQIVNRAVTGGGNGFVCNLKTDERLECSGQVKNPSTQPLNAPLREPVLFLGRLLADRFSRAGLSVDKVVQAEAEARYPQGRVLHVIQSTIGAVLHRCNKDSQNLFAEALCKRTGFAVTGRPGSWADGAAAGRAFLVKRLGGELLEGVVLSDGSGMSRDNRVSSELLARLITSMARDPQLGRAYLASLSAAGDDGTLERRLQQGKDVTGKVYGKTGYIAGVSTISGFLVEPAGPTTPQRWLAFSMLFNDIPPKVSLLTVKALQNKLVQLLDQEYAPR